MSSHEDELILFKEWFLKTQNDYSRIRATLTITTSCNLSCAYCFEKGLISSNLTINQKTEDSIIEFLCRVAVEKKSKSIALFFYGGEPTLFPEKIRRICKKLNDSILSRNITPEYNMYTNGTLVSDELINTMKANHFKNLQITLDGPPELHDIRRPFINKQGSFQVIFNNIMKILETTDIHITLLMNYDNQNYKRLYQLLRLFTKYCTHPNLEFVYNPLFVTESNSSYCNSHSFKTDSQSAIIWAKLYKKTLSSGFNCNPLRIFESGPCSFLRASHFVFDTNGDIFKCIGFVGNKNLSVGNTINDENKDVYEKIDKQLQPSVWENDKCLNCLYLPLCIGGCRFHSLMENNNISEPFCHDTLIKNCDINLIKYIHSKTHH